MSKTLQPTTLSTRYLESSGWLVGCVERVIPRTNIKQDLFGFADLVACKPGVQPTLVQVTSNDHVADRRKKILASHKAMVALMSGFRIVVHGWEKPTKTLPTPRLRSIEVTMADFDEAPPP